MKKKIFASVMAAAMTCSVLVGCGSDSGAGSNANVASESAAEENAAPQEEAGAEAASVNTEGATELSIWVHETDSDEGKLYKKLVDDFNQKYEGTYYVTLNDIPRDNNNGGYSDAIMAAITSNSLPDVFTADGVTIAQYADAGNLQPLDDYFTAEELNDFSPSIIQQGTYQDKLYALGCFDSSVGLFYNKTMFEEAGIEPATKENPWTLAQLKENAAKLTTANPAKCTDDPNEHYGIIMSLDARDETLIFFFLPLIQSQGTNVIDADGIEVDGYLNSDKAVNALAWIQGMADEGYAATEKLENGFALGYSAMAITGSWEPANLAKYDIEWGLMPMPMYDENSTPVSPCGSWTFVMSSNCPEEKREGAAELIRYMTSTDAGIQMYAANSMPPARQSAFSQIADFQSAPLDVFQYQAANTAQARPVSVNYAILSREFANAVGDALTGADPKESLDKAVEQYEFNADIE